MPFYAVQRGRNPGVYTNWSECQQQVNGYAGAVYKKFNSPVEAASFAESTGGYSGHQATSVTKTFPTFQPPQHFLSSAHPARSVPVKRQRDDDSSGEESVGQFYDGHAQRVAVDGSCRGNGRVTARAGYGVFFGHGDARNVSESLSGEKQTNQRAELQAAVAALERSDRSKKLIISTDSKYVQNGVTDWVHKWKSNGWKTYGGTDVENKDLWTALDQQRQNRDVAWEWVRGHSTHVGNRMADELAVAGALKRRDGEIERM